MDIVAAPVSTAIAPKVANAGDYTPEQLARLAKAKDVSQKFEAAFIYQFMELSSPKPDKNNPIGGSFGEEMFRHQMNEQAAGAIAQKGGFGLADRIMAQLALRGDIPPLKPAPANAYRPQPQPEQTP